MVLKDQVQDLLEAAFPGGQVSVVDFGGGDHLAAHIRAPQFAGLPLIAQHKLVYAPVQHLLDTGDIHALKIKTEAST
ncbi:MAG: BolA/IbaG family iron-sulfur metabolism protein [Gaiellales bacterium]